MTAAPVVQLFYNPRAGSFSARKLDALARAFRAEGADVVLAPSVDSPPAIDPQATHVCIAGGDGTIRHVAAMLVRAGACLPLVIHPIGTVNLLAREIVPHASPAHTARSLLRGQATRPHSPVAFGDSMFFVCASVGPDSAAVARLSAGLKARIGRTAYLAALLDVLLCWPRPAITLSADTRAWRCEAVYVAKGRYYAGPWSFAPNARGADGKLHVLALRRARRRDYLRFVGRLLLGRDPATDRNTIAFTCSALSIASDCAAPIQADGDIVASCPVDFQVLDQPITFCEAPARAVA